MTQNEESVQCKLPTDRGQTVEECRGYSDIEGRNGTGNVLIDIVQTVEVSSRTRDTKPTDGTM